MNISKVEEFMGNQLNKEILKKAMGDGPEFELVYEALLKEQELKNASESDSKEDENYVTMPAGTGAKLESIPMRIRKEPIETGEISLASREINRDSTSINNNENKYASYGDTSVKESSDAEKQKDIERIYSAVDKYSKEYGVDKNLVLSIIKQESNFDANAVSSSGAMGVMQLMDFNCEAYGVTDPYNIEQNVQGGVRHIKEYLDMFDGNTEMALMAYNGGPGTMERRGVTSTADLYKMPSETQSYVPKVMNYYKNGF